MSDFGRSTIEFACAYAIEHGIDVAADQRLIGDATQVKLTHQNREGASVSFITDGGADYMFSQLDYLTDDDKLRASRMIAKILGGKRTELAFWTEAAPTKQLTVHRGLGNLVIGNPKNDKTTAFQLDPEVTPTVTLPPGRFYTFEAALWTPEPLVVSGLYETDTEVNWEEMEITLQPGQEFIEVNEATIKVPDEFRALFNER